MISVLLPTHNGSRTIARAVRSVLAQSHRDLELLILDDGSTDDAAGVALAVATGDARVRVVKNERNLGIQKTLNKGLALAKGDLIARIDDDDEWVSKTKLEEQFAYFNAHSGCVLVGTGTIVVDEEGREIYRFKNPLSDAGIRNKILFRNCFTHSSVMFGKTAALAAGGYGEGEDTRHVEDWDLWLRMGQKGSMANLPQYTVRFFVGRNAISSKNKLDQMNKATLLARKFSGNYPRAWMNVSLNLTRYWAFALLNKTGLDFRLSRLFAIYKNF